MKPMNHTSGSIHLKDPFGINIPLVKIEETNILIYWDKTTNTDPDEFEILRKNKRDPARFN